MKYGQTITITIDAKGAAFDGGGDDVPVEVARILKELARSFTEYGTPNRYVLDINGNVCGSAVVTGEHYEP